MTRVLRSTADQVADLQTVMRLIDVVLEEVSAAAPPGHQALIPNALLNLAIDRILAEETPGAAATILYRLAELLADGKRPQGSDAFPLNGHDA